MIDILDWAEIERALAKVSGSSPGTSGSGTSGFWRQGDGQRPDEATLEEDPVWQALKLLDRFNGTEKIASTGEWAAGIDCPWSEEHGPTRPGTGAEYVPGHNNHRGWFYCFHHQDRDWDQFIAKLNEMLHDASGGLVSTIAALEFDEVDPGLTPANWKARWQRSKNGTPASNVYNVLIALHGAPELAGVFGFNEFTLREMLLAELPGVTAQKVPREWRDQDTIMLQTWLQGQGLRAVTSRAVDDAVSTIIHENAYHPIRDWLTGLSWDRVPRLDEWVARYLGTPQDPYHAAVGRWWLMTMCRRVYEPGCRADYMPVLEGPQGQEKSSMLCALAGGPEWFSDGLPDISSKDASDHLNGRWLIEIAEMDRHDQAESAAMKAFLSRTAERYRKAYGRRTGTEPRQCIFVGTVNHQSYLKDETGNRRYWPIAVGQIDLPGLVLVRDQLFAEAWDRAVSQNEQYWPDPLFEELFMAPEQDQRLEPDLWEPLVAAFLRGKKQILVRDVTVACTGGGALVLSTMNRNRVTRIMQTLRWKPGRRGPEGERFWYPY